MAPKEDREKRPKKRNRIIGYLFLLLFILLLFVLAFLFIPALQNKTTDLILSKLNKNAAGNISIENIDFNIFKGIEIDGLYVEDHRQDTLLYVEEFNTGLAQGLKSLFFKDLFLDDITADNIKLRINTYAGEFQNNLNIFLNSLIKIDTTKLDTNYTKLDFGLSLKELDLNTLDIKVGNENGGMQHSYVCASTFIQINDIDIQERTLLIEDISLQNLVSSLDEIAYKVGLEKPDSDDNANSSLTKLPKQKDWELSVEKFKITQGDFAFNRLEKIDGQYSSFFDPRAFSIKNIELNLEQIGSNLKDSISIDLGKIDALVNNKTQKNQIKLSKFEMNSKRLIAELLEVKTPSSRIKQKLALSYYEFADFKKFTKYINFNNEIFESTVSIEELSYYLPKINELQFYKENKEEKLELSGQFKGRIENFSLNKLELALGDRLYLDSDLRIRNITNINEAFLVIDINEGQSSIKDLRAIIPKFVLPENFDKLGKLQYSGRFNGFVNDFVSFGELTTELGKADLDLRLDTKGGRSKAKYTGEMDLFNFNLKKWTDDDRFGSLSMNTKIKNGRGLSLDLLRADIEAKIAQIDYNGKQYEDLNLNGVFEKQAFNGNLAIDNQDIVLDFEGDLHIEDDYKLTTDLNAVVGRLDLKDFGLSEESMIIEGVFDLELQGKEIEDFTGTAELKDLHFTYKDKEYKADSLYLSSFPGLNGRRSIYVNSDLASFTLEGFIDFESLPQHVNYIVQENFTSWFDILDLNKTTKPTTDQNFSYKLFLLDSKEFFDLLKVPCLHIEELASVGEYNTNENRLYVELDAELLECNDFKAADLDLSLNYLNGDVKSNATIQKYNFRGNEFPTLTTNLVSRDEKLKLRVSTDNLLDEPGRMDFEITAIADNDSIRLNVTENSWSMFESDWFFEEGNEIVLAKDYVNINDLLLTDGYRNIIIDDHHREGVSVKIENVDFDLISPYINFQNVLFNGELDIEAGIYNVFEPSDRWFLVESEDIHLDDISYGSVRILAETPDMNNYQLDIFIDRPEDDLNVLGLLDANIKEETIDGFISAQDFDLSFLEFIIPQGIKNTEGIGQVEAYIQGDLMQPTVDAKVIIDEGKTNIDYLNNELIIDGNEIFITHDKIIFENNEIQDVEGNTAIIRGSLQHRYFKDWYTRVDINSDRFVLLNTDKNDNPDYYGYGVGSLDMEINGPFSRIDMEIDAVTAAPSIIHIPTSSSSSAYEESFITFVNKEDLIRGPVELKQNEIFELEGIDLEMNLSITDETTTNIIFDEELNDIIRANGRGDLAINIKRTGEFDMFGNYEIVQGSYLFTALGGFVTKPFSIKQGSTINWTGDPLNADLNISAELQEIRTSLEVFLAEYLVTATEEAKSQARKSTDVDLEMLLSGTLFAPEVKFDLSFPDLTGELSNYTNNKVRTLHSNEAELNDQVASLLLFESFLPSSSSIENTLDNLAQSTINSLSDFLSSQLSYYISGFLNEVLDEDSYITGIDFQVGFNTNTSLLATGRNPGILPDEIEVHLMPQFQGGRWGFDVGTNYVRENYLDLVGDYFVSDFVVEYYITQDRRLKLRIYGKYDFELTTVGSAQRVQKYGVGLSFRKEFGTMLDLKKILAKNPESLQGSIE